MLLAIAVGAYGCGVVAALLQLAYTRTYADQSGQALAKVVGTAGYTVAPWLEELVKVSPLVLAGFYAKVRRQWGVTDFVVLGAGLGAGFGLLEAVLRFGLDAGRAIPRDGGGWVVPDSLFPPYVPGPEQVFTAWLPAPFGQSSMVGPPVAETFSHLVWTALAGLGVGLLWRTRGWVRLLAVVPVLAASAHHMVNNYAAEKSTQQAEQWLETLNARAWAVPLICLTIAMAIDLRRLHLGKRALPGVQLASERIDGDTATALLRYAAWRFPWSLLIVLRYVRLRRSLLYTTALAPPDASESLYGAVAQITAQMDASDHQQAWQTREVTARLKAGRARFGRRGWVLLVPCVLMLPSLLFLGVGSFTSAAELQQRFTTGSGPKVLMGFGIGALAWIAWQLSTLLRAWRIASDQPLGELLEVNRFRIGIGLGAAATGSLLLYHGLGDTGPDGKAIAAFYLLEALDTFLVYLGFALLLLSLLALFPPGGLALAGVGVVGAVTAEAAISAAALGTAGLALMGSGAHGTGGGPENGDNASGGGKGSATPKEQAASLGYNRRIPPQKAPFDSHGQDVFSNGKRYISPDTDAHNVSNGWKMFDRRGRRIGTYDSQLNRIKD